MIGADAGSVGAWDELLAGVTAHVAHALDEHSGAQLGERAHQEPITRGQLAAALSGLPPGSPLAGCQVDRHQQTLPLEHWKPRPRGVDVGIKRSGETLPRCVLELKLRELGWTLWDFIKMLDAVYLPGVERSYLLVGATEEELASGKPDRCLELFALAGLDRTPTVELFAHNRLAWFDLLTGGTGRPTSIPAVVSSQLITSAPFQMDGRAASLLCVAVDPVLEADRVVFEPSWYCGDWPAGVEAPERYMHWKRRHWQLARAVAEAGGSMGADAIEDTAGSIGFNYAREFGLYYRGEPMFRKRQQTVALARAGQVFVAEWEQSFAD